MAQAQQKQLPGNTDRFTSLFKGGAQGALKDEASQTLRSQAAKGGNATMNAQTAEANVRRDAMLEFIAQRLAQAKVLQARELDQLAKSRVWYDEVAKGKAGFKLPDPTRWKHCAGLYQRAIESITAGQLGRGAQLLDQAVEAEKAVYHSLPSQVERDDFQQAPLGVPDARLGLMMEAHSDPTKADEMLAVAREIGNVTSVAEDQPFPQRQRPHTGWWAKGDEAGEETAKKAAPAAHAEKPAVEHIAKSAAPAAAAKQEVKKKAAAPAKAPAAAHHEEPHKEAAKATPAKAAKAMPTKPTHVEEAAHTPEATAKAPAKAADHPAKAADHPAKAPAAAHAPAKAAMAHDEHKQEANQQAAKAQKDLVEKLTAGLKRGAKPAPKPAAKPAAKK